MILPLADIHAPLGSFFPVLLFLGYPIFFIYLLNRSVMGDIGCVTAILMAFTVIYLLGVVWKINDPRMHYLAVGGICTLFVALPILEKVTDKIMDKQMEGEQISVCYEQLRFNPQNAMAAFRLAQLLYARGEKGTAVAIASEAVKHLPAGAFREEHRQFAYWRSKIEPANIPNVRCASCGNSTPPSALICPRCLGSIHLDRARMSSVLYNQRTQKIVTIWSSLLLAIFIIPMTSTFPPIVTIPVVSILLVIAVWAVVSAFVMQTEPK